VDPIITILLVIALVKTIVFGWIVFVVFRKDIREYFTGKRAARKAPPVPTCMYCQSKWTQPIDEGQTRWDKDELILVTTYECQHCHLPFWHVERVPTGSLRR
jgi:5-methylcytosine-specific restriction endonuclease McrA